MAGDTDHALAGLKRLGQHLFTFYFLDQANRFLRRPHPGTGALGKAAAGIEQGAAYQIVQLGLGQLRHAVTEIDPHNVT